jgi:hypothetical protein
MYVVTIKHVLREQSTLRPMVAGALLTPTCLPISKSLLCCAFGIAITISIAVDFLQREHHDRESLLLDVDLFP